MHWTSQTCVQTKIVFTLHVGCCLNVVFTCHSVVGRFDDCLINCSCWTTIVFGWWYVLTIDYFIHYVGYITSQNQTSNRFLTLNIKYNNFCGESLTLSSFKFFSLVYVFTMLSVSPKIWIPPSFFTAMCSFPEILLATKNDCSSIISHFVEWLIDLTNRELFPALLNGHLK